MPLKIKILGVLTLATNGAYVFWLALNTQGVLGHILFGSEVLFYTALAFFMINHWQQKHVGATSLPPTGSLDVFITVVNEPLEMFEDTLAAASMIEYDNKHVYVLDDGNRPQIAKLAHKYEATYMARSEHGGAKSGNLNYGLGRSDGKFVLVLDADQVVEPQIATDLLGYFGTDSKLAIVTTKQRFLVPPKDFNHDHAFYDHAQPGKNNCNAAISTGSGVFYRRSALEKIDKFPTWNLVEDLYTSYLMHSNGFTSLYIDRPYTTGTAPLDLGTIYKQRGTWGIDTLRVFFWKNPLLNRQLTWRQRIHYSELSVAYLVSGTAVPLIFCLPALTLITGQTAFTGDTVYAILRIPSLVCLLVFVYVVNERSFASAQYYVSLFPVYFKALVLALRKKKPRYIVTRKTGPINRVNIRLAAPHLLLVGGSLAIIIWRTVLVDHHLTLFGMVNFGYIAMMTFWFWPVLSKAFGFGPQEAKVATSIKPTSSPIGRTKPTHQPEAAVLEKV